VAFSSDGKSLVAFKEQGGCRVAVWNVGTRRLTHAFDIPVTDTDGEFALSEDGRLVVMSSDGRVLVRDLEERHVQTPRNQPPPQVHQLAFHPPNGTLVTAGDGSEIGFGRRFLWDSTDRSFTRRVQDTVRYWHGSTGDPMPNPTDQKTVAPHKGGGEVYLWRAR
jgi:WD40 repeat protein